ncbi:hypothetical protein G4D82_07395 [Flavobacterium sp. CYK-4]|uniref:hypothetical protein n=1 Tax=Flavobacterium lotistagni TaxID=2709660 RepID=UPI00140B3800|nr:hypothetical protein [Flavobacterium lotistagni]NHM07042.1 hypothetical protein [Flavobacterium lotistagni]
MKNKWPDILVILTSFMVYLEWGTNQHCFLFQAEKEILNKLFINPMAVLHPLTIIPMLSQLSLLINLTLEKTNKVLVIIGISGLAILIYFIFLVGILAVNIKIVLSTLPFLIASTIAIGHYKRRFRKAISIEK